MFHDSKLVDSGSFSGDDNLYILDTIASFNESMQFSIRDFKRILTNDNSVALWHRRLDRFSI